MSPSRFRPCAPTPSLAVTLAAVIAGLMPTLPAIAQVQLDDIVITANRTATDINKVGATVEVIDRQEIEAQGQAYVKDYLNRLPGITVTQNGPPGSASNIQIRGALGQYVKVLIDGIDVTDVAAPQAVASFEHLLVGDIERIEVLKGAQSTLYGSEAVGGVISITTRRAARGIAARGHIEGGSYNTQLGVANVSYGTDKGDISFTAEGVRSDGFSAADENAGNTERDGYENRTFSGTAQYRFNDALRVFFVARSTSSEVELDGFSFVTGLPTDNLIDKSTFALRAVRGGTEIKLFDGRFTNTLAVQHIGIDRENFGDFPATFASERTKYEYQGVARFSSAVTAMVGAARDEISARTTSAFSTTSPDEAIASVYGQLLLEPFRNFNLTAGARRDDYSTFGTFDTYRFTTAYYVPDWGTKLRASYGTAFRAPSLFELYDPVYGNTALTPEESRGWDAGIDQTLTGGRFKASATYFDLNIDNLVQFVFPVGYSNVPGETRRRGVELAARAELTSWLTATGAYTFTDAVDALGNPLIRVPRYVTTLGVDAKPTERLTVNATLHIVRDTLDSGNFVLDNYELLNANVSYALSDNLTAYIRGVNLLNQEYQVIRGYGTSDLAFYAGLKLSLDAPQPLAAADDPSQK